jgi:hypothetical protein
MSTCKIKCEKLATCLLACAGEEGFVARRSVLRMTVIYLLREREHVHLAQRAQRAAPYRLNFLSGLTLASAGFLLGFLRSNIGWNESREFAC